MRFRNQLQILPLLLLASLWPSAFALQPANEPNSNGTGIAPPPPRADAPSRTRGDQQPPQPDLPFGPELKAAVLKEISNIVQGRAFSAGVDFKTWPDKIAKQQEKIDNATTEQAFTSAVNQAFREFGISHMSLQSPRAAAQRTKTTMVGIGVSLAPQEDGLHVMSIVPDAPAANAGIQIGDVITKIDGEKPEGPESLRGDEGTSVTVTVKNSEGTERDVVITRKEFSIAKTDTLTWIDEETAILKVHTFAAGYSKRRISDLVKEASAKAKYLILDLRNNGGGSVDNLNQLLSHFIPAGTAMGTNVGRPLASKYQQETGGDSTDAVAIAKWAESKVRTRSRVDTRFEGKVAVLINRGSASASEIAAAALRDCVDAKIIGSPTAGAVLVSTFVKLPGRYAMQVPLSEYVTIKGQRLEGNPVKPDVEVASAPRVRGQPLPPSPPINQDVAILKAVEVLHAVAAAPPADNPPADDQAQRDDAPDNRK
ncbi:MAG: PDZ domain-containing protein [Planctomycetes bacterium]|nr:PDZ domain-containing protein [Planctomycetota bacterium]